MSLTGKFVYIYTYIYTYIYIYIIYMNISLRIYYSSSCFYLY